MGGPNRIFALIRRVAMPALAVIVVGTFAGHAIAGPNGILAWGSYHRALHQRQAELAQIEQQRAELRSCWTPTRPIPTWPTSSCARSWAWSGPTR